MIWTGIVSPARRENPDIDVTPPADYLSLPPSAEEHLLARQTDLHSALVPWWMFAKVALRLHSIVVWVARADGLAARTRRWLIAGVTIAAANLGGVAVYTVHRIEEGARADERAGALQKRVNDDRAEILMRLSEVNGALQRQLDDMRQDIRELRRALQRLSGRDPLPDKRRTDPGEPESSLLDWQDGLTMVRVPVDAGRQRGSK